MKIEKKIISKLNKCYSISPLTYQGTPAFLVASEKQDSCRLFSEEGKLLDTIWTEPGGTMTMAPIPSAENTFLAIQRFYSPDDSKEAKIVIAEKCSQGGWTIRTLCNVPFAHRFGIMTRAGTQYLLVCCLKTGHSYPDDWRSPGACYAAVLPEDLSSYDESNQLQLFPIKIGMLKNHGYCLTHRNGYDSAVIGSEEGVFIFRPPISPGESWEVNQILTVPTSDAVLMDFDGDGNDELGCIAPFHGNSLTIYHLDAHGKYIPQWKLSLPERETEMIHATWACDLLGKPTWIVGWRKGTRSTIAIHWDDGAGTYVYNCLDSGTGCANAMHFVNSEGEDVIIAANREIDEIAMYIIREG